MCRLGFGLNSRVCPSLKCYIYMVVGVVLLALQSAFTSYTLLCFWVLKLKLGFEMEKSFDKLADVVPGREA